MKRIIFMVMALCAWGYAWAETVTARYFGSEIDLSQKYNPCKGNTDGGVEVIVVTNVTAVQNAPDRTFVERIYSLPNGEVLKKDKEVIDKPKAVVLHKLFPHEFPEIKM